MKAALVAALLALAGCSSDVVLPAASNASFDPVAFFEGTTHGEGILDTLVQSPVEVRVDSVGRVRNGTLILDQTIRQGAEPARVRRWLMRREAPNLFSGGLTDATGPVQVITSGPRAHIRYRMKNGLQVEQWLALQSDRRTVLNRLEVTKFGLRLATLTETIRKLE